MKKKQLFLFTETSVAAKYGIGTYIRQVTDHLSCDLSICVVTLFSATDEIKESVQQGVRYLAIPYRQGACSSLPVEEEERRYYKRIAYLLKKYVSAEEVSYFHLNISSLGLAYFLREHFKKAKLIYTLHYIEWKACLGSDMQLWEPILEAGEIPNKEELEKDKAFMGYCDAIITFSTSSYYLLQKVYEVEDSKLFCLPNSVEDLYDESLHAQKINIKKKYGFEAHEQILLFAGRIVPNKGILELTEAFKNLALQNPSLRLLMVGDGCYGLCLERVAPLYSKLCFTGFIDRKQLIELYHMADIGVLPSHFEECGYVALEMMAAHLPLVATHVPGLADVTEGNGTFPVASGNRKELEAALADLLADPARREVCAQKGRSRYEQLYAPRIFRENLLETYSKL